MDSRVKSFIISNLAISTSVPLSGYKIAAVWLILGLGEM
jgi:hypothetical protein